MCNYRQRDFKKICTLIFLAGEIQYSVMRIQPEKRANKHQENATCCYLTNNIISQTIQVYRKNLLAFPFFFPPAI